MKASATLLLTAALSLAGCHLSSPAPAAVTPAATTAAPMASASPAKPVYLVHDNGKRCIVAPCPSLTALDVATRVNQDIAGVDLAALHLDPAAESAARKKVTAGQVWVRGEIVTVPKMGPAGDGKVLRAEALLDATGHEVMAEP